MRIPKKIFLNIIAEFSERGYFLFHCNMISVIKSGMAQEIQLKLGEINSSQPFLNFQFKTLNQQDQP